MGKTLNLISPFSGKVGAVVGAVRKNSRYPQILRQYQPSVSNPKTALQYRQRLLFATISQAMSSMYDIVNHSFENVENGQKSLNYFVQQNLLSLKANEHLNYNFKGNTAVIPNELLVSKGSLQEIKVAWDNEGLVQRSVTFEAGQGVTNAAFLAAFPDFEPGDQLTACYIVNTHQTAAQAGNIRQPLFRFHYDRVVTSTLMADNPTGTLIHEDGFDLAYIDQARTTNGALLVADLDRQRLIIPGHNDPNAPKWLGAGETIEAACLIHSKQDSRGNWERSTAYMSMNDSMWAYFDLESAVESYQMATVAEDYIDDKYLNNAIRPLTGLGYAEIDRSLDNIEMFVKVGSAAMVNQTSPYTITTINYGQNVRAWLKGVDTKYYVLFGQSATGTSQIRANVNSDGTTWSSPTLRAMPYEQVIALIVMNEQDQEVARYLTTIPAREAPTNP